MLSKVEREYIGDPETFEQIHNNNYVRKIRNNIRKKVGISIEELSKIIQFSQTKYDKDQSKKGRYRKSILPYGSINVLTETIKWLEANPSERKTLEQTIELQIQLTLKSIFEDTKIGKELYK